MDFRMEIPKDKIILFRFKLTFDTIEYQSSCW